MRKARFRCAYDEDHDPVAYGTENCQPSLTDQSQADACDVNKIMEKYERHGLVTHVNQYEGEYADVTGAVDYHEALNIARDAEAMFMTLPSRVREEYGNDPGAFLDAVDDPGQKDRLVELGILKADDDALPSPAEPKEPAKAGAAEPAGEAEAPETAPSDR